jgi:hypothetical protein
MVVVDLAITREGEPWQLVSSRYYKGVAPGDLISHPGSDQNQHRKCPRTPLRLGVGQASGMVKSSE